MKIALVVAALLALTVISRQRVGAWRDERTLWSSAWETAPTARAAVNLSLVALRDRRFDEVDLWTQAAMSRAAGTDALRVAMVVQAHLRASAAMGSDVCGRPPWASWC